MTEKLTRICLPGLNGPGAGLMDWGEHSYEDMRKQLRARAASMKEEAEAVLAAPDDAFKVTVVRGSIVQHFVRDVLPNPGDAASPKPGEGV